MFNKNEFRDAAAHHAAISAARRDLQAVSTTALGASKRSIFATQRDDEKISARELGAAKAAIKKGMTLVGREPRLLGEGVWRAALEEFTEASMYHDAMFGKKIEQPREIVGDTDTFIGALSDLTGELVRSSVIAATTRDAGEVKRLQDLVREAVAFLLTLDLTGTHRQKFDQAKQNLRKIEEIAFNLSLHAGK
jgi:predicted translin family RNA/ssDNA-binding protein